MCDSRYYVNPSTWWIGGVLAAVMPTKQVQCADYEAAHFNPPPERTCQDYAGDFVRMAGQGYLTNPDASENCGYCAYANGSEYLRTLNIYPEDKWRDFGIFLVFVFTNWMYVLIMLLPCLVIITSAVLTGHDVGSSTSSSTQSASAAGPSGLVKCLVYWEWPSDSSRSRSLGRRKTQQTRRNRFHRTLVEYVFVPAWVVALKRTSSGSLCAKDPWPSSRQRCL